MTRVLAKASAVLRAIAHAIAETIRFGALASAAAPRSRQSSDATAVVAGLGGLSAEDSEGSSPEDSGDGGEHKSPT